MIGCLETDLSDNRTPLPRHAEKDILTGDQYTGGTPVPRRVNMEKEEMSSRLPFEIREAVVAVCGKAFWLKDPFRAFFCLWSASGNL